MKHGFMTTIKLEIDYTTYCKKFLMLILQLTNFRFMMPLKEIKD